MDTSPEEAIRSATRQMVRRALRKARKKGRTIFISKTSNGKRTDIRTLDPDTPEGSRNLDSYLTPACRHYTFSGLGDPEDRQAVPWRTINLSLPERILVLVLVAFTFVMKGSPMKNRVYRLMGAHIGKNVEIMQLAWLDHFRPDLIFIGDQTLVGAYTRITVHAYEGSGKFRYGLVEIGSHCVLGAGTGIGPMLMEDGVRTLPGTTVSPYLVRVRAGSVVGYDPPSVKPPPASPPSTVDTRNIGADVT